MRLVGWTVQPIVMADDGESLTAVQTNAQLIPTANWALFKEGGDLKALDALRAQIEGATAKALS